MSRQKGKQGPLTAPEIVHVLVHDFVGFAWNFKLGLVGRGKTLIGPNAEGIFIFLISPEMNTKHTTQIDFALTHRGDCNIKLFAAVITN